MKSAWNLILIIFCLLPTPQALQAEIRGKANEEVAGSLGFFVLLLTLFLLFLILIPLLCIRQLKKGSIGTKPLSFFTAIGMMQSFGNGNISPYDQFSAGTGIFADKSNWKRGGSGSSGKW